MPGEANREWTRMNTNGKGVVRRFTQMGMGKDSFGNLKRIVTAGIGVDRFHHLGTPKVGRSPFSLREAQQDSATKPGVAPGMGRKTRTTAFFVTGLVGSINHIKRAPEKSRAERRRRREKGFGFSASLRDTFTSVRVVVGGYVLSRCDQEPKS